MENIKETQKAYEDLFESVEDYKSRMRRLSMNFNGGSNGSSLLQTCDQLDHGQ